MKGSMCLDFFLQKKIPKQNTHLCDFKSPLSPNLSLEKKTKNFKRLVEKEAQI